MDDAKRTWTYVNWHATVPTTGWESLDCVELLRSGSYERWTPVLCTAQLFAYSFCESTHYEFFGTMSTIADVSTFPSAQITQPYPSYCPSQRKP